MEIFHNQIRYFQSESDSYTKSKVISAYHSYLMLAETLEGWAERFDNCSMVEQRNMLSQIIDKVVVYDDKNEIIYSRRVLTFMANAIGR